MVIMIQREELQTREVTAASIICHVTGGVVMIIKMKLVFGTNDMLELADRRTAGRLGSLST